MTRWGVFILEGIVSSMEHASEFNDCSRKGDRRLRATSVMYNF